MSLGPVRDRTPPPLTPGPSLLVFTPVLIVSPPLPAGPPRQPTGHRNPVPGNPVPGMPATRGDTQVRPDTTDTPPGWPATTHGDPRRRTAAQEPTGPRRRRTG
ncbi:hypothetical protein; putative signal peptide [Frankia alni ACN14a]|uniref:Uncharacterized protein n=1 Tax=Frankia alni (strain DSM 45986 / CECT 9034 / ACN14a) TaxID=326424 RepID=Q0RDS0_FRAAA|nr:hypothetical protein; putative signal peptide [Frankia alni ACN14a]